MEQLSSTPPRLYLLNLLMLTMASSQILAQGGIFYSPKNSWESNVKNARRKLKQLKDAKYAAYKQYPLVKQGSFRRFYHLTDFGFQVLGEKERSFHEIHEGLIEHDSLTALFLTHLYRCCSVRNISLRWQPPFDLGDKTCDGAVVWYKNGQKIFTVFLESDTGSHDHREICEKMEAFLPYIADEPRHNIVFLTQGFARLTNLRQTIQGVLEAEGQTDKYNDRIFLLCPSDFPPHINLFSKHAADHPSEWEQPDNGIFPGSPAADTG